MVIYSKNKGKLELVAKGSKKNNSKVAAHIEPLNLVDIMVVSGKQFNYIGSAISRNCFINIKNDFNKVIIACEGIRIFNKLIKSEYADEKIFYLLKNFLLYLNSNNYSKNIINFSFKLKLISLLGYKPELYNCVYCNKKIMPNNNKFSFDMGGIICLNDFMHSKNYLNISNDCIKLLISIINFDFYKITKSVYHTNICGVEDIKIKNRLLEESNHIISSFLRYKINSL